MPVVNTYACDDCDEMVAVGAPVFMINWAHPTLGGGVLVYCSECTNTVLDAVPGFPAEVRLPDPEPEE